jgi:hypothetical protein
MPFAHRIALALHGQFGTVGKSAHADDNVGSVIFACTEYSANSPMNQPSTLFLP